MLSNGEHLTQMALIHSEHSRNGWTHQSQLFPAFGDITMIGARCLTGVQWRTQNVFGRHPTRMIAIWWCKSTGDRVVWNQQWRMIASGPRPCPGVTLGCQCSSPVMHRRFEPQLRLEGHKLISQPPNKNKSRCSWKTPKLEGTEVPNFCISISQKLKWSQMNIDRECCGSFVRVELLVEPWESKNGRQLSVLGSPGFLSGIA